MRIFVQKFGGTSVASQDRMKRVFERVRYGLSTGSKVIVVLSARSGKTNKLLDLAHHWADEPDLAELDVLVSTGEQASVSLFSIMLKEAGIKARSMLGYQIPILTDDDFGSARIRHIDVQKNRKTF